MISLAHIPSPRVREQLVSSKLLAFIGWDAARPGVTVECCGLNERQAIDGAALKLRVPGWRVRVRPALPRLA